ncbi:MAG: hypothetical protein LBV19_10620 [Streptococcaceae bacterium]|jgi:ribosomal protein S5|nr:hypothetical protein [Streptococcaceae bacterium]
MKKAYKNRGRKRWRIPTNTSLSANETTDKITTSKRGYGKKKRKQKKSPQSGSEKIHTVTHVPLRRARVNAIKHVSKAALYFEVSRDYILGTTDIKISNELNNIIGKLAHNREVEIQRFTQDKLINQGENFSKFSPEINNTCKINVVKLESIGNGNWCKGIDQIMSVPYKKIPDVYDFALYFNADIPPSILKGDLIFIKYAELILDEKVDIIEFVGTSYVKIIARDGTTYFIRTFLEDNNRPRNIAEIVGLYHSELNNEPTNYLRHVNNGKITRLHILEASDNDGDEFESFIVGLSRYSQYIKTKGVHRQCFAAVVAVGDYKGRIGLGTGKSHTSPEAIRKATEEAKKNLFMISIKDTTIPYEVEGRFGDCKILLEPAYRGKGIYAKDSVKNILELSGIKDITFKESGSHSGMDEVFATFDALIKLRLSEEFEIDSDVVFNASKGEKEESTSLLIPIVEISVEAMSIESRYRMVGALEKLSEESEDLIFSTNPTTWETVIAGTSLKQLNSVITRLKTQFGIVFDVGTPQVIYHDTFRKTVPKAYGRYEAQLNSKTQFAEVWIEFIPNEEGKGFEFENAIDDNGIPSEYIPAVQKGIEESMTTGVLATYPLVDIKARLHSGSSQGLDQSEMEMAFKTAGALALRDAAIHAELIILEPIMKVMITVPEVYLGKIIRIIGESEGKVEISEKNEESETIHVNVPLVEMLEKEKIIYSATEGRAFLEMVLDHYSEVRKTQLNDSIGIKAEFKFSARNESESRDE